MKPSTALLFSLIFPAAPFLLAISNSSQETVLFEKTWGGIGDDVGNSLVLDSGGNIYVVGETNSFGAGGSDVLLLKYDSSGSLIWERTWGGLGMDSASSVVVDSAGSIYITGTANSFGPTEIFLVKFNSSGDLIWQRAWVAARSPDIGESLALDSYGNIYVTGCAMCPNSPAVVLLKFNSTGGLLWQKTWQSRYSIGLAVAVDSSDDIYVTGASSASTTGNADVLLLKFNSTGGPMWQKTWGGLGMSEALGIATDFSRNVYLTGLSDSVVAGTSDLFLFKIDSSGNLTWQRSWGGSNSDFGQSVVVDSMGTVYVTGTTASFGNGFENAFILKFSPSGALVSQATWGGNGTDHGQSIAVDPSGRVYVTGYVSEAPPYIFETGNAKSGVPALKSNITSGTLGNPTGFLSKPVGNVSTPVGRQTYAGAEDVFLVQIGIYPPPDYYYVIASTAFAVVIVITITIAAWKHKSEKHTLIQS